MFKFTLNGSIHKSYSIFNLCQTLNRLLLLKSRNSRLESLMGNELSTSCDSSSRHLVHSSNLFRHQSLDGALAALQSCTPIYEFRGSLCGEKMSTPTGLRLVISNRQRTMFSNRSNLKQKRINKQIKQTKSQL